MRRFVSLSFLLALGAAGAVSAAVARPVAAQSASLHYGRLLNEDGGMEELFPTWGLRVDHAVTRWLVVEGGAQYAPVELVRYRSSTDKSGEHVTAPRLAFDAQLQLQLPLGRARPYVGVGRGVFTYERLPETGLSRPRLVGYSTLLALGLRVDLPHRLGVRGALLVRRDRPSFGEWAIDVEPSLGVSVRW